MHKRESIKERISNALSLSFPWEPFPSRTKIAAENLSKLSSFKDIKRFFSAIDKDLDMRRKTRTEGDKFVNFFRFGGKETVNFFKDNFPEIEDMKGFLSLLQNFGFNAGPLNNGLLSDALVYFYKKQPGGFIYVQSADIKKIEDSQFCLMCQRNPDGTKLLDIAGIYSDKNAGNHEGRIISARYKYEPKENAYIQTELDIAVGKEELPNYLPQQPIPENMYDFDSTKLSPLITAKMLTKASQHDYILSLGRKEIPPDGPYQISRIEIPQKITTK